MACLPAGCDKPGKAADRRASYPKCVYIIFDTNPYSSGNHNTSEKFRKIRLCCLPLSVDDSAILELLEKLEVKPTSKILYEKIRHPITKKMTSVLNGNRFLYIVPMKEEKHYPESIIVPACAANFFILVSQSSSDNWHAQSVGPQTTLSKFAKIIPTAKFAT